MGAGNGKNYFNAYKSIYNSYNNITKKNEMLDNYLIKAKSISNFINIINKDNLFDNIDENNKNISKSEEKLIDDLKNYKLEENIVIYSKYEQYKNIIEQKDKEENEFIVVDEKFLDAMKIKNDKNAKIEISFDGDNKDLIEIKFNDSEEKIPCQKCTNISYKFLNKEEENNKKHYKMNIQLQLQCLTNIKKLKKYFLSNKENIEKYNFSKYYLDIINHLSNEENKNKLLELDIIKNELENNHDFFLPKNFILAFFQNIHDELNEYKNNSDFEIIESQKDFAEIEHYNIFEKFNNNNKSIISDIFYFEQLCINKCLACQKETYDFSMINHILFNINEIMSFDENKKNINIYDCFDIYTNTNNEKSNNKMMTCVKCKAETNYNNEKKFDLLPEVLTIILDNSVDNSEVSKDFIIDYEIDLSKYLFNWNNHKKRNSKYELIGMISYEKDNKKIYFGYCKSKGNKWYFYNGADSKEISTDDIKGIPHLLLYQQLKN